MRDADGADRPPPADRLRERLLAVIERGAGASLDPEEFDDLARELFRHQYRCNAPYRAYCEARGIDPGDVDEGTPIPAVPTDAFKAAVLLCGDPAGAEVVFRTSGTTAGLERRGTHAMLDTSLYRAALRAGFQRHLLPDRERIRILSLVPPASELPDSSLSFMLSDVVAHFGEKGSAFYADRADVRIGPFLAALRSAVAHGEPVLVAGTSFAFLHLLDRMEAEGVRLTLPPGSRAMDTGGFKGRLREVTREQLYAGLEDRLGIPVDAMVNEYGMTEMSSQLYLGTAGVPPAPGADRLHRGPPWVRSVAVDPETLEPLADGELGVLRHLDLANLDSVAALQTADLGRVTSDGILLVGRASGAEVRGCSLAMEELLEAISTRSPPSDPRPDS
jgi:hypothetical protein